MPESDDPLIGARIGNYILKSVLGQGAMGTVYLAEHEENGQVVAIKFLSGEFATKPEFVQRFINEAASSSTLEHPNIIKVFEAGQQEGVHFMVMEYVDGVNLAHFLKVQDHVKELQVRPWLRLAAEALKYSHSMGIIHRDLKPENIMLTKKGVIKIADLGLSKNTDADENFSVTMSGTVIGTPYYISPEQIRNAKHVDSRTDMYSLGATFYHLVAGVPPFQGDSAAEVMSKHMNDPLANPQRKVPSLSDPFCNLLMHMMEKDPSNRFQTMEELVNALDALEGGRNFMQKLQVRKEGRTESQIIRRRQAVARNVGGIALTAFLLVIAFVLFAVIKKTVFSPHSPTQKQPPIAASVNPPAKKPTDSLPVVATGTPVSRPTQTPVTTVAIPTAESPETTVAIISSEKNKADEEEMTLKIGDEEKAAAPVLTTKKIFYNWVDLFAFLLVFLGIPMGRHLGSMGSLVRAAVVWISVVVICIWFEPITNWFHRDLSFPNGTSAVFGFSGISMVLLLPAWTFTQRLRGHEKETWRFKLDQTVALVPSIILGMGFTVWIMAFLAITIPDSLPINQSWVGAKMYEKFPSVYRASQMFNDEKKK